MIPTDPLSQVQLLLSGASTVRDPEVRAVYLASARSLLDAYAEKAKGIELTLQALETELGRSARRP